MKTPMKKEQGAILVMGALILVILIGIAAYALDLGRLYVLRAEMQNAVDAAAISAASELDGEAGARDRAMLAANQEILNHLAHFSKQSELLQDLQAEDFTFYSWIGSKSDPSEKPSDCSETEVGKCDATGDDDASYVKINLQPEGADDSYYTVDLFFLPVLSLVTSEPVATTASTRVAALAGSHLNVCDFPPVFICDPTEGGGSDLIPGQQVVLHEQGPGAPWGPGTFGWLHPYDEELDKNDDPLDDGLNSTKLLAHRLGSRYAEKCTSTLEVRGGQIANWPRWALNTRFGIYKRPEYRNQFFLAAPNIVEYPRDDNLTLKADGECEAEPAERFGNGDWNVTECHPDLTQDDQQPSTFSRGDYRSKYHTDVDDYPVSLLNSGSRFEHYNWELSSSGSLPDNNMSNIHDDEKDRIRNGDPSLLNPPIYYDEFDVYKRRELFVGVVACAAHDVKANSVININDVGVRFMRFFLTEQVPKSSEGIRIYAEFIEQVGEDEDEHFKNIIQLYE